jgi:hypothetical protein
MKEEGKTYPEMARFLYPRTAASIEFHFRALKVQTGKANWSYDDDLALKRAYQKKKNEFWAGVATEMGFEGSWKVVEKKAVDVGLKTLSK